MEQYISKSALIAEIEKKIKEYQSTGDDYWFPVIENLKNTLSFLDTLEVKEVDLEKELGNWRHEHFHGRRDKDASGEYLERESQLDLVRHFFELGIKEQKGE